MATTQSASPLNLEGGLRGNHRAAPLLSGLKPPPTSPQLITGPSLVISNTGKVSESCLHPEPPTPPHPPSLQPLLDVLPVVPAGPALAWQLSALLTPRQVFMSATFQSRGVALPPLGTDPLSPLKQLWKPVATSQRQ